MWPVRRNPRGFLFQHTCCGTGSDASCCSKSENVVRTLVQEPLLRHQTIEEIQRQNQCQNRSELLPEWCPRRPKSVPEPSWSTPRQPWSTPRQPWSTPRQPRSSQGRSGACPARPGTTPRASWEHPGSPQGRAGTPEKALGSTQKRFEAAKIDAKSPRGVKKSRNSCTARSSNVVGAIFRRRLSIFGFVIKWANPLKYCPCQQKQRFCPSRCELTRSYDATVKNKEI